MSTYDVVFVGSTPDALAGAARLARQGKKVLVLDARGSLGGPVTTEEFAPGFRADTALPAVTLDEEVAADLGVSVERVERPVVTVLGSSPVTLRPGEIPGTGRGEGGGAAEDAVRLLRAIARVEAPEMPRPGPEGAAALGELGARLLGLGGRRMHEVLRLLFMPARDLALETELPDAARAALCASAIRAVGEGPYAPGTLFNHLQREALGDGLFAPAVRGGLSALTAALADRARALGAEVRAGAGALHVVVEDGAARGVLAGGERIEAGAVVSCLDVRATFTRLVPPYELPPEVNRAIRALRYRGSVARVHLALRDLPAFEGAGGEALRGTLVVAPDIASLERAWDEAKRAANRKNTGSASPGARAPFVPSRPYVEVTVPSAADGSFAPGGGHVLSASVQYVPYGLGDREALVRAVIERLSPFCPGLEGLVLHREVLLPEDLEARFGLSEGHLFGGEMNLAQAFFLRGVPGCAGGRSPIDGLYLAGSACHPGGHGGLSGWRLSGSLGGQ